MKKTLIIALLMLSYINVFGADFKIGQLSYFINADLESVTLEDANVDPLTYYVTVPDTVSYNGIKYVVNKIGDRAFYSLNSYHLKTVILPSTIKSIGNNAFLGCTSLDSINLPNSIINLGAGAFRDCKKLINIIIPESLSVIEGGTFAGCISLREVDLPNSITYIGNQAFSNCKSLQTLKLSNTLKTICDKAFSKCNNLSSVFIPRSVTNIGISPFEECSNLANIMVEDGNLYYDSRDNCNAIIDSQSNTLIGGCNSTIIPSTVKAIGDYAFYNCSKMIELMLPKSISRIGNYAFYNCTGLTMNLVIPDSVLTIGEKAFYGCCHITSLKIGKLMKEIGQSAFSECTGLILVDYNAMNCNDFPTKSVFEDTHIKRFVFGGDVQRIPNNICKDSRSLLSINIGNSVQNIGDSAFYSSWGLSSINIPNSVVSIGDFAFYNTGITVLNVPNSVKYIGDNAFSDCQYLISLNVHDAATIIGNSSFKNDFELRSVSLGQNIISIGDDAFYLCRNIDSITIPNTVVSIGERAFYDCLNLQYLSIGKNVKKISSGAFYGCEKLTHLFFNAICCDDLDYSCFYKTPGFSNVVFSEGVEHIPSFLCWKMQMTSMTLPETIQTIGDNAFSHSILEKIKLPNSLISIGKEAFYDTKIKTINVPNSVSNIGFDSFSNCVELISITIPESLSVLCENFREQTNNLTSIYSYLMDPNIPIKINHLGNPEFFNQLVLQQCVLYVPKGTIDLYKNHFIWNKFANIMEFDTASIGDVPVNQQNEYKINAIYTIDGKKHINLQPGINIIKYDNGQTEKLIVQ